MYVGSYTIRGAMTREFSSYKPHFNHNNVDLKEKSSKTCQYSLSKIVQIKAISKLRLRTRYKLERSLNIQQFSITKVYRDNIR